MVGSSSVRIQGGSPAVEMLSRWRFLKVKKRTAVLSLVLGTAGAG